MDVFKLLNRSAKKAPHAHSAQKLPSSGAVANPQLFGHHEPAQPQQAANTSRKRKRGHNTVESAATTATPPVEDSSLPADLDFFAGASKNDEESKSKKERRLEKKQQQQREAEAQENGAVVVQEEPYDEDECKRVLRSHKLKIAVLEAFAGQEEPVKEKKKRKKDKDREAAKSKKKDGKKQLYPRPLTSFAQLRTRYGISRRLAENIHEQGYKLPTEVQLGSLPLTLARARGTEQEEASGAEYGGEIDLLTVAPTGSGKTIAFLIPVINTLLKDNKDADGKQGPRAVVLAPTRELASQIVNEARKLAKGTAIKATLMRKGMEVVVREKLAEKTSDACEDENSASDDDDDDDDEEKPTKHNPPNPTREPVKAAILVATPLALLNALTLPNTTTAPLPTVRRLVLDEADVLLDPLFRAQTLAIWNACTNPSLRISLWSATMGSNIEPLALSTLNTRWAALSAFLPPNTPRAPLLRLVVGLKDSAIPNISHQLTYAATEQGKLLGLRNLLHPSHAPSSSNQQPPSLHPPFLIFTQSIPRAIALHAELRYDIPPEAGGTTRIAVLHADLSSSARDAIMTRFRSGHIWILITTDLLARGIDFRGLNGVVNFDAPSSAAAYVHRVGRTGRAGRQGGVAVTFYTDADVPYIKLIANVIRASEKMRGVSEEEGCVKGWLLDALPDVGRRERGLLKRRGVESRRVGKGKGRISTKSGYERRRENNRRGAREASWRRGMGKGKREDEEGEESAFEGFE